MNEKIGIEAPRIEAWVKTSGGGFYVGDLSFPGMLHGALLTSPHASAKILEVDLSSALEVEGVRGSITGDDCPGNLGIYLGDKPPLARGVVRHWGEPVAAVAADTEAAAREAVSRIKVEYEVLPGCFDVREAMGEGAPLLHPEMATYNRADFIYPREKTNIANHTQIRKGDVSRGYAEAAHTVSLSCSLPAGDHAAMEPRGAVVRIAADGAVDIWTSSQAPFVVRDQMARIFDIPTGKVRVITPRVGGGFGGKAGIQLEGLVYLLSKKAGGVPVRLLNTREEDLAASPGRIGLSADIRLAADSRGRFTAFECSYFFNTGAYGDYAVNISRAAAISCTGPYRIPSVKCDSYCVYTNTPFASAFRGFGHIESSFVVERAIELLAEGLQMDPLEIRLKNSIAAGDEVPTGALLGPETGDLRGCAARVAEALEWDKGCRETLGPRKVRAKGISFFWKAPAIPTNTDAGAILTFNEDGSVNLLTGIVDIGTATQTGLVQIAAEALDLPLDKVHILSGADTAVSPHDWSTAASRSLMMAGMAVLDAAEDALDQIKRLAAVPLQCPVEELAVAGERVFLRSNPQRGLELSRVVLGYSYPDGRSIGGQVIGRGKYITEGLTGIDRQTGRGNPALEWTLGAEGVEVELDPRTGEYRVLAAAGCMDVGKVINLTSAREQMVGAMMMGIGYACEEGFRIAPSGRLETGQLRTYKIPRLGEAPRFSVDFLETPQPDGPMGARGLGEQGIIGMPGAVAAALSRAAGCPLNHLPLSPERVWRAMEVDNAE